MWGGEGIHHLVSLKIAEKFEIDHKHVLRAIYVEIIFRFFILKLYFSGISENQIGAIRWYYRQKMKLI